ncbi:hypothetical protein [Nocardioides aurantiacus]|uniref:Uncharacterized protein n=1 Tax=Nocardioides aurantiacus TaxID=86796 RepID=A0A3N2CNT2_9ACTN|nr:hypothetical protein [Nocardioides aurantiacus]ROR89189.1 hypothetical protein EDD33_0005 [Nocardioides aurantiacus]
MAPLDNAVRELRQILASDPSSPEWRWHVRVRLQSVQQALAPLAPPAPPSPSSPAACADSDAWLSPRVEGADRRTVQLRARVGVVASGVLDRLDAATIEREVRRLLRDLEHLLQRDHDLVYDSVSLDLGGSE